MTGRAGALGALRFSSVAQKAQIPPSPRTLDSGLALAGHLEQGELALTLGAVPLVGGPSKWLS